MKAKAATIDEYLAGVDPDTRAALERLRGIIMSVAPKAEETITYQIPIFRLNGMLVGFGAGKNHCAFYPCSGSTVEAFKNELKNYKTGKGTIRFQPEKPLSVALIRKIVKTRIAENAAKCEARLRKARKAPSR